MNIVQKTPVCKHYCAIKQMISSESGILGIVQEYDDEMSSEDVHGGGGPSVLQLFNSQYGNRIWATWLRCG